jgi:hypothetical protein
MSRLWKKWWLKWSMTQRKPRLVGPQILSDIPSSYFLMPLMGYFFTYDLKLAESTEWRKQDLMWDGGGETILRVEKWELFLDKIEVQFIGCYPSLESDFCWASREADSGTNQGRLPVSQENRGLYSGWPAWTSSPRSMQWVLYQDPTWLWVRPVLLLHLGSFHPYSLYQSIAVILIIFCS